jgi:hypothetical protein
MIFGSDPMDSWVTWTMSRISCVLRAFVRPVAM